MDRPCVRACVSCTDRIDAASGEDGHGGFSRGKRMAWYVTVDVVQRQQGVLLNVGWQKPEDGWMVQRAETVDNKKGGKRAG